MEDNKITFSGIIKTIKEMPRTVRLIFNLDKRMTVQITLVGITTGLLPLMSLLLSQELINSIVRGNSKLKYVLIIFISYVLISIISDLFSQILAYLKNKFQYTLQYKLNYVVMCKSTDLELKDYENANIYNKLQKIVNELPYKPYQMFDSVSIIISSFVTMVSSLIFLFMWNIFFALILLLVPALSLIYFLRVGQEEFEMIWGRAKEERKLWYLCHIMTHDFSFKEIHVYQIKKYLLNKYWILSDSFIKQNDGILRKKTFINMIFEGIIQLLGAIVIGAAILSAFSGRILVGSVMSYIKSVNLIQSNSQNIVMSIYNVYSSNLYMDMLFEFLNYNGTLEVSNVVFNTKQLEKKSANKTTINSIEFKNVCFKYAKSDNYALKNISFRLNKGERVALVGPNGSGKSTLVKILLGLYKITEGEILINGIKYQDQSQLILDNTSVLFQDFMKYELSLKENIAFGDINNIDKDEEIKNTLKLVKADFIGDETINLEQQLGVWFDDGRELSQGQWQKIALARAFFSDSEIFVLDEPNSSLDTVAEKEIFIAFFKKTLNKIGIYISHKLNPVKSADKVIVLEHGKLVGIGKHDELLKSCDIYKQLYLAENEMI